MKSDKGRRAIDTVQAKDCYDPADYVTVHKDYWAKLHRLVERALASSQGKTPEVAPPNEQPRMNYAATKQYAEEMGLPTDFTDPAVSEALKRDAERWIPVSERLPADNSKLLLAWGNAFVHVGYWCAGEWLNTGGSRSTNQHVTHWMPFPKPPAMQAPGTKER